MNIDITTDFSDIFGFAYKFYKVLETSAILLWAWLSSPIDAGIAEFLMLPAETMNIELVFGSILIAVLVTAAVALFVPFM